MSLSSILNESTPKSTKLQEILKEPVPDKNQIHVLSGHDIEKEYKLEVDIKADASVQGDETDYAFRYAASFLLAHYTRDKRLTVLQNLHAQKPIVLLSRKEETKELSNQLKERFISYREKVISYILEGGEPHAIIPACYFFAKLEKLYRKGKLISEEIEAVIQENTVPEDITIEVQNMMALFQSRFIEQYHLAREDSSVFFHPDFYALASPLEGAEPDLLIDQTLVVFKTESDGSYHWKDYAKLIGYYLLHELNLDLKKEYELYYSGIYNYQMKQAKIERLALYKARHGEAEIINVQDLELMKTKRAFGDFLRSANTIKSLDEFLKLL